MTLTASQRVARHHTTVVLPTRTMLSLSTYTVDGVGRHPSSGPYVEKFWLPVVGPSVLALARNLERRVVTEHKSRVVLSDLAGSIGIAPAKLLNAIARGIDFHLMRLEDEGPKLSVRLTLPSIRPGMVARLPEELRSEHDRLVKAGLA